MSDKDSVNELLKRLRGLRTHLADWSLCKHCEAIEEGHDTIKGAKAESQSHAYVSASVWLEDIVTAFENGEI